ncbi:MAG: transcription elongation factor GreA [Anaerolineaceae bacterium]|nr:transcription elongation factor GreA [Anaerolineaceae bacterium]
MITKTKHYSKNVTYITPKGLEKLENELNYLRIEKRREIAPLLHFSMSETGDNEYMLALEEKAFLERRILQLEKLLSNIHVINPGQNDSGQVEVGNTVVIREGNLSIETYTIVGVAEADPSIGLISNESPLGEVLLGSSVGDDIEIEVPDGKLTFRVLAVQ